MTCTVRSLNCERGFGSEDERVNQNQVEVGITVLRNTFKVKVTAIEMARVGSIPKGSLVLLYRIENVQFILYPVCCRVAFSSLLAYAGSLS